MLSPDDVIKRSSSSRIRYIQPQISRAKQENSGSVEVEVNQRTNEFDCDPGENSNLVNLNDALSSFLKRKLDDIENDKLKPSCNSRESKKRHKHHKDSHRKRSKSRKDSKETRDTCPGELKDVDKGYVEEGFSNEPDVFGKVLGDEQDHVEETWSQRHARKETSVSRKTHSKSSDSRKHHSKSRSYEHIADVNRRSSKKLHRRGDSRVKNFEEDLSLNVEVLVQAHSIDSGSSWRDALLEHVEEAKNSWEWDSSVNENYGHQNFDDKSEEADIQHQKSSKKHRQTSPRKKSHRKKSKRDRTQDFNHSPDRQATTPAYSDEFFPFESTFDHSDTRHFSDIHNRNSDDGEIGSPKPVTYNAESFDRRTDKNYNMCRDSVEYSDRNSPEIGDGRIFFENKNRATDYENRRTSITDYRSITDHDSIYEPQECFDDETFTRASQEKDFHSNFRPYFKRGSRPYGFGNRGTYNFRTNNRFFRPRPYNFLRNGNRQTWMEDGSNFHNPHFRGGGNNAGFYSYNRQENFRGKMRGGYQNLWTNYRGRGAGFHNESLRYESFSPESNYRVDESEVEHGKWDYESSSTDEDEDKDISKSHKRKTSRSSRSHKSKEKKEKKKSVKTNKSSKKEKKRKEKDKKKHKHKSQTKVKRSKMSVLEFKPKNSNLGTVSNNFPINSSIDEDNFRPMKIKNDHNDDMTELLKQKNSTAELHGMKNEDVFLPSIDPSSLPARLTKGHKERVAFSRLMSKVRSRCKVLKPVKVNRLVAVVCPNTTAKSTALSAETIPSGDPIDVSRLYELSVPSGKNLSGGHDFSEDCSINESENIVAGKALALSEASSQIPTATSEALTTSEENTQSATTIGEVSLTTIGEVSLTTALTVNKECSQTSILIGGTSTSSEEYSQCTTATGESLTSSEEHSETPSVMNNENIVCDESVETASLLSNSLTNIDINVQTEHVGDVSTNSCLPGPTEIISIDACDQKPNKLGSVFQSVERSDCSGKNLEMDTRDPSEADIVVSNSEEIRDRDKEYSSSTDVTDDSDNREKFNNCKLEHNSVNYIPGIFMKDGISMPETATKAEAEIGTDLSEVSSEVENKGSDRTNTSTCEVEIGVETKVDEVAKEQHLSIDASTGGKFRSEEILLSSPVHLPLSASAAVPTDVGQLPLDATTVDVAEEAPVASPCPVNASAEDATESATDEIKKQDLISDLKSVGQSAPVNNEATADVLTSIEDVTSRQNRKEVSLDGLSVSLAQPRTASNAWPDVEMSMVRPVAKKLAKKSIGLRISDTSAAIISSGQLVSSKKKKLKFLEEGELSDSTGSEDSESESDEDGSASPDVSENPLDLDSSGSLTDSEDEKEKQKHKEKKKHDKHKKHKRKHKHRRRRSSLDSKVRTRSRSRSYSVSRTFDEETGVWRERKRRAKVPRVPLFRDMDKGALRQIAVKAAFDNMERGTGPRLKLRATEMANLRSGGGKSVEEFTDFCKNISNTQSGWYNSSDSSDEDRGILRQLSDDEDKVGLANFPLRGRGDAPIVMNIRDSKPLQVLTVQEKVAKAAALRLMFPVSSGSQHHEKEKEWVPVEKPLPPERPKTPEPEPVPTMTIPSVPPTSAGAAAMELANARTLPEDSPFNPLPKDMDIQQIVAERLDALRRLQKNPQDGKALEDVYMAQMRMQQWSEAKQVPGQFFYSVNRMGLMGDKLKRHDWLRNATNTNQPAPAQTIQQGFIGPVHPQCNIGKLMMQRMGWKEGEGLGKGNHGTVTPLQVRMKSDRKGLHCQEENPQLTKSHQTSKEILQMHQGKHPISILMETCFFNRWSQPNFILVEESGPPHLKYFLFKVIVNGVEYQPCCGSTNKKTARLEAALTCINALGIQLPD